MREQNGAGLLDYAKALPQYLIPQHRLSLLMHKLTRSRMGWLKNSLISFVVRQYQVNMAEAEESNPLAYGSFNEFFTRALKPGIRPVVSAADEIACPVDGRVSQAGNIEKDQLIQAKGHYFDLRALLGNEAACRDFENGQFATIYLSPRDYHRIHCPMDARLRRMRYIPGHLFSVSPATTRAIPGLFARNERVVMHFDTAVGPMILILVGAIFVGSMETVWAGQITPPYGRDIQEWEYAEGEVSLQRGDELGRFNMGSTVICLFGEGRTNWAPTITADAQVQMGQLLAKHQSI